MAMTSRNFSLLIAAIALGGCLDSPAPVTGEHHQYIVTGLYVPRSASDATKSFGIDLDLDGRKDNGLGSVLATLLGQGFDIQPTLNDAVLRGNILLGLDVQTPSFTDAEAAGVQVVTGITTSPNACNTAGTCGLHLSGDALMMTNEAVPQMYSTGPVTDGTLLTRGGILPVRLAIGDENYIDLNLHNAAIKVDVSSELPTGTLAGIIPTADVARIVIPQFGKQFRRIAAEDCAPPPQVHYRGANRCQCKPGSRGELLTDYLNSDLDCTITDDEVRNNSIVKTLLAPDMVHNDEAVGLSFGVGISLAPATFVSAR